MFARGVCVEGGAAASRVLGCRAIAFRGVSTNLASLPEGLPIASIGAIQEKAVKTATLKPAHFFALVRAQGTSFFTGVPDSLLKDACAYVSDSLPSEQHKISANEGTALAMASGHYLATGAIPCVYLQNSGLGNLVNPLLSLCSDKVYSIPTLLLIGWRGEPGKKDEPQHVLQGPLTPELLDTMGVPYDVLPDNAEGAFQALDRAYEHMKKNRSPYALLVKKGTFGKHKFQGKPAFTDPEMLHREDILEHIVEQFPETPIVSTTGFTSRELFELRARRGEGHGKDFLTVGSMGHCSSIAAGVALAQPHREVLCIDGDGAAVMHLGAFVTAGLSGAKNFKHVLINNAAHDSVGGQPTGAENVDFAGVARACGYRSAWTVRRADEIPEALRRLHSEEGPCLLEIQALAGARADLGRPTTSTIDNKEAFMSTLAE